MNEQRLDKIIEKLNDIYKKFPSRTKAKRIEKYDFLTILDQKSSALLQAVSILTAINSMLIFQKISVILKILLGVNTIIFLIICFLLLWIIPMRITVNKVLKKERYKIYNFSVCLTKVAVILFIILFIAVGLNKVIC